MTYHASAVTWRRWQPTPPMNRRFAVFAVVVIIAAVALAVMSATVTP